MTARSKLLPSIFAACTESVRAAGRRTTWSARVLAWFVLTTLPAALLAESDQDRLYRALDVPLAVDAGRDRVVLVTYPCPDCNALIRRLEQQSDGDLLRMPAIFDAASMRMAVAHYVIDHCGLGASAREQLMEMPRDQSIDALAGALLDASETSGPDRCQNEQEIAAAFDAPAVSRQLQQALAWSRIIEPSGLPALVLAGRWVIEDLHQLETGAVQVQSERLLQRARAYRERNGEPGDS